MCFLVHSRRQWVPERRSEAGKSISSGQKGNQKGLGGGRVLRTESNQMSLFKEVFFFLNEKPHPKSFKEQK